MRRQVLTRPAATEKGGEVVEETIIDVIKKANTVSMTIKRDGDEMVLSLTIDGKEEKSGIQMTGAILTMLCYTAHMTGIVGQHFADARRSLTGAIVEMDRDQSRIRHERN